MAYARVGMLFVCFLVVLLDGLDTGSIALVAPMLAREWGLTPAMLTPAFIATSVGAVAGYISCGPLIRRFGQRTIGIASVVLFGAGTLLTTAAYDVSSLSILRFVTAIGFGGALPIAVTVSSNVMPEKFRSTAAVLVATGLSAGGVVGGLISGPLMLKYGWPSIFIVGGVLPLLLLPLFSWVLSASDRVLTKAGVDAGGPSHSIAALFADGFGLHTGLLWLFAFLIFMVTYALSSWIPTLLVDFGFSPTQAPLAAAAFGAGGLAGNMLVLLIVGRFGIKPTLMITSLCAIASVIAVSCATMPSGLLLPLIGVIGAGLISGCVGQSALAVSLYPAGLRTIGVGWAAALGRIGSIVGPAVGGVLLAFNWSARDIILTVIPPTAAAMLALAAMVWVERRQPLVAALER